MTLYKVNYQVNTLAHIGKLFMEPRITFVESNVSADDQNALMEDIRKSLSSSDLISEKQIKVMGWSEY